MSKFITIKQATKTVSILARDVVKVIDDGWERFVYVDFPKGDVYNTSTSFESIMAQLEDDFDYTES